jgi:hypothetical protein
VGDFVRIVRLPSGIDAPGYVFPAETRTVYQWLIERGRAQRVYEIDEWGLPWIYCRFPNLDPRKHPMLAINDDSWVLVRRRSRRRRARRRTTGG